MHMDKYAEASRNRTLGTEIPAICSSPISTSMEQCICNSPNGQTVESAVVRSTMHPGIWKILGDSLFSLPGPQANKQMLMDRYAKALEI